MNGFGKELKKKIITGKIFHKCTVSGLCDLVQNYNSEDVTSFSTEKAGLFKIGSRPITLVLNVEKKEGMYTPFDADAGKNFGHDEFLTSFENWNEIESKIVEIQIDNKETYFELNCDEDGNFDFFDEQEQENRSWILENMGHLNYQKNY